VNISSTNRLTYRYIRSHVHHECRYSGLVQMGSVGGGTRALIGVAYEAGPEPGMNCTDACSVRFIPVTVG
jgi:hypothetical protein